jgi:dipeptidyl aminopeptidase/acylaminoacyl peptidase
VAFSASVSNDGTRIAYKQVESRTAGDVYVMDLPAHRASRLVEINPELHQFELGELKPVSWKSFDGAEIWGLLLTPPGYKPGTKVPLVVYCHGGPIGGFTYGLFPQFMHIPGQVDPYPVEAMASAGMAVLFPMPRGGSGYGVAGFRTIIKSWGEVDYKDIMAGVDAMVERGIADPDRLGVMGGSYGGFMTNWIVTQTVRFKAASSSCSLSDLAQMYFISDAGDFMIEYFGLPWEANDALIEHSPITHVRNVQTPLLIQHGENDNRVPVGQAKEFYRALKALNKRVELDIYPRGGHVNFEPPLEREYWRRNLQWFTYWLGADSPAN